MRDRRARRSHACSSVMECAAHTTMHEKKGWDQSEIRIWIFGGQDSRGGKLTWFWCHTKVCESCNESLACQPPLLPFTSNPPHLEARTSTPFANGWVLWREVDGLTGGPESPPCPVSVATCKPQELGFCAAYRPVLVLARSIRTRTSTSATCYVLRTMRPFGGPVQRQAMLSESGIRPSVPILCHPAIPPSRVDRGSRSRCPHPCIPP